MKKNQKDWSEYYSLTKKKPPSELLVSALKYTSHSGKALDMGAGALKNTLYLIQKGFEVTAIDKSPLVKQAADLVGDKNLKSLTVSFEEFSFPKSEYDLITAMYALPFTAPQHFEEVFENVKNSLKKGGIFCGTLFGKKDEWSTNTSMTFHSRNEVDYFLKDMNILFLEEREEDGQIANGNPKHWHVFNIIAQSKS